MHFAYPILKGKLPTDNNLYELFSKISLKQKDLILPLFIADDHAKQISSSNYFKKIPYSYVTQYIDNMIQKGITSIIIFGTPRKKSGSLQNNTEYIPNDMVTNSIKRISSEFKKKVTIFTDICICQDNPFGHCGITTDKTNHVENDMTLKILGRLSLEYAKAGSDYISPSSMMDGQVRYLRSILNDNGYKNTKILSFSAKHNSALYAPFRNNMFINITTDYLIDKSNYQVSFFNPHETIREIQTDINEGADMVMIKPSMFYLDLVYRIKRKIEVPMVVQNVSGEYYLFKAGIKNSIIFNEKFSILLFLESIKNAGADKIISYFSPDFVQYLK